MVRKVKKYERILKEFLSEYINDRKSRRDSVYQFITDAEHHHYQVIRNGWDGDRFIHHIVFHFEIKDDAKIWVWVNNTDIELLHELLLLGVPDTDVVVGFYPPSLREMSNLVAA